MIKVVDTLFPKMPGQAGVSRATQAYTASQLLMEDTTNGVVIPATSSTSTLNVIGIGSKTFTEGSANVMGGIKYTPVITGAVFVVADCTNVTAANQLHKNHVMTDSNFVNNTSTTSTAKEGIFHALAIVGPVGGTQLYGYFIRSGQVTA